MFMNVNRGPCYEMWDGGSFGGSTEDNMTESTASQTPVQETETVTATPLAFSDVSVPTATSSTQVATAGDPARTAGLPTRSQLNAEDRQKLDAIVKTIDPRNSSSILTYCSDIQKPVNELSQQIINGARNKDAGPVGEALVEMSMKLRGLNPKELEQKQGLISRMMGKATPVVAFVKKYETIEGQIQEAASNLEGHRITLMESEEFLDQLYGRTLTFYHELELRVIALDEAISTAKTEWLPAAKVKATSDDSTFEDQQAYRDLQTNIDDMERRFSDLLITRAITQTRLPAIRMMQDSDKALVRKISSQLVNTIAAWRDGIALGIKIAEGQEAAAASKVVSDTTDAIISQTATMLREGNKAIRTEVERSIVSVDVVTKANDQLIGMLQDTIDIAKKGKEDREQIARKLSDSEGKLKSALIGFAKQS